jgi:hypothetical protein
MRSAKEIVVKPIAAEPANAFIKRVHYSGRVVKNSQLHFGVYLDRRLEGVIQLGPSMAKEKVRGLVRDTPWNGFMEVNRLAFTDYLPRNSESRALGYVIRLVRARYPFIQWLISYADACQCGDGTIYRAAGFVLTQVKKNYNVRREESGKVRVVNGRRPDGYRESEALPGFMLRYLRFLDPTARERLTVPIIPFSELDRQGVRMARGSKFVPKTTLAEASGEEGVVHAPQGGSTPTPPLHSEPTIESVGDRGGPWPDDGDRVASRGASSAPVKSQGGIFNAVKRLLGGS